MGPEPSLGVGACSLALAGGPSGFLRQQCVLGPSAERKLDSTHRASFPSSGENWFSETQAWGSLGVQRIHCGSRRGSQSALAVCVVTLALERGCGLPTPEAGGGAWSQLGFWPVCFPVSPTSGEGPVVSVCVGSHSAPRPRVTGRTAEAARPAAGSGFSAAFRLLGGAGLILIPGPTTVTSYGKRVSADVIKLRI